ncbi:MAG TPA: NHL repeat-containing protein [Pyrinomonadaceae bacterium]|nr:NHL repeat-containing protein [Pyrinomonadaceae bacterium]
MRKLLVLILLLAIAGAIFGYLIYRRRPLPTPVGWKAHVKRIAGDGSPVLRDGKQSGFSDPFGVAVAKDGTIYVSDAGESNRIRKISPDGNVTTLAGGSEGYADGVGPAASFNTPSGLALGPGGNLFVADTANNRIRKITPDGHVSTVAGDGTAGYVDGPAAKARFNGPIGLAVSEGGDIYVADTYNDVIRMITTEGEVTTIAGAATPGYADGEQKSALFDTPCGIVIVNNTLIVADTGNDRLRRVSAEGNVTTLPVQDLSSPIGLAVSHDNYLYVTELDRSRVLQVAPDGVARVIAGDGPGFADGSDAGRFNQPTGIAIGPVTNKPTELFLADSGNYLIRKLDQTTTSSATAVIDSYPRLTNETLGEQSLLWPFDPQKSPHEVAATIGEVRGSFDSTDSRHHLHSGLDVFGGYGEPVHVVHSEKVTGPIPNWGFDSINEGFRVGAISYIHIHVGRDKDEKMFDDPRFIAVNGGAGKLSRVRVKRGTRFNTGDTVGTVNKMYHVHLNVGPPGGEINPLSLSPIGFTDTIPPTIEKDGIQLFDSSGARLKEKQGDRLRVSGSVRIVVDAFDRTNMNAERRRLGLYKLGYQVLKADGSPAPGFNEPRINILFNRLPGDRAATKVAYAAESGITVYGSATTRFLYEVTNTVRDGRAAPGVWDTSQLPKGDYILRIIAADYSGNEAQQGRDVPVSVINP